MTRTIRWPLAVLLLAAAVIAIALWLLFPWGPIRGLRIEQSRYLAHGASTSNARKDLSPPQVAIVFSVPKSLEATRTDKNAGFINATLSVCDDADRITREVVTQRAGYFPDEGRVRVLPAPPGEAPSRHRYQAVFDDPRQGSRSDQRRPSDASSSIEGLCFALDGSSMWAGKLWSDTIRVNPR